LEPCRDDPYSRPARRTQWLLSALAHHYGSDRGVENEIIVLATGLDQYLQEVFHHLDWGAQDSIPGADFRALCQVLGLEPGQIECEGLLGNLPERLTFRQFHARLCGYFSGKAGSDTGRLPSGTDTEHIETQIRLRSPRRRRDPPPRSSLKPGAERSLEQENSNLRELVEDLRAALQSSDARCLALQVSRGHLDKGNKDVPWGGGQCWAKSRGGGVWAPDTVESWGYEWDSAGSCFVQSVSMEIELKGK
uniref:Uncharacterized protein n=1 Tax=Xenopus tropicalis TaxID=8364 RepID=A0A803J455_XENTR